MNRKNICISFDWHNDRNYRYLLSAWNANPSNPFDFEDLTPTAIDSENVGRVKAALTRKIREATHTLILIGEYANTPHEDQRLIGSLNWIWWEIEKSKEEGNRLIAVKLQSANPTPKPLYNSQASWAMSFTWEAILKAIDNA